MARPDFRQGSYKGVPFECQSGTDDYNTSVALFDYPNVDLPDVQDMGTPEDHTLKIFFLNAKYADWQAFKAAVKQSGPGELIHPWEGSMQAIAMTVHVLRDNRINCAEVDVTFKRVRAVQVVTVMPTLKSKSDDLAASNASAFTIEQNLLAVSLKSRFIPSTVSAAGIGLSGFMATVTNLSNAIRAKIAVISAFVGTCLGYVNVVVSPVQMLESDATALITLPGAILDNIATSINSLAGTAVGALNVPGYFMDSLDAGFASMEAAFGDFGGDGTLEAIYYSNKARAKVTAAALDLRADEAFDEGTTFTLKDYGQPDTEVTRNAAMSMDLVDQVTANARGAVNAALASVRANFGQAGFALEVELKAQAAILQEMADEIRIRRPEIISYTVTSEISVHLLCFYLYQDIGRAAEILKLNRVPDPNFLTPGTELRVYAA
jgi:prophage DNA circulation protein